MKLNILLFSFSLLAEKILNQVQHRLHQKKVHFFKASKTLTEKQLLYCGKRILYSIYQRHIYKS